MENTSQSHPEPEASGSEWMKRHRSGRRWGGLIIFITGMFLLLQQLQLPVPSWVLSWPMYLVVLGVLLCISSRCHNMTGVVFILIGGIFLVRDIVGFPAQIYRYIWPVLIMAVGLILILRPHKRKRFCWRRGHWREYDDWKQYACWGEQPRSQNVSAQENTAGKSGEAIDWFDTTAVFCGMRRKIISKHFKGGDVVSCFGGVEIDLTHADVQGKAIIDAAVVFGGLRLFVPASWDVRVNMTNVMGGVDDRRELTGLAPDPNKILTLTGAVVMGGVEIRSFST